jgi:hypothetical protein
MAALLAHDPPDDLFANARAPNGTAMGDTAEYQTFIHTSNRQPSTAAFTQSGTGTVRT